MNCLDTSIQTESQFIYYIVLIVQLWTIFIYQVLILMRSNVNISCVWVICKEPQADKWEPPCIDGYFNQIADKAISIQTWVVLHY